MAVFKTFRRSAVGWIICVSGLFLAVKPLEAAPRLTLSTHHVPAEVSILKPIGRMPADTQLQLEIGLPPRNAAELDALLQQIYDPASTNFHHYLSPEEFNERFGPTPEDYQTLIDFSQANGLTVTKTFPGSMLLVVSGSVADIEKTFHVSLKTYQHPKEARTFYAPDTEPTLDLSVPVQDINGLDNFIVPHPMSLHKKLPAADTPTPNAHTGSGPGGNFIGNDFRTAYAPGVTLTGAGQTVALLEFDGYFASDITAYESLAGLPNVPLSNVLLNRFSGAPGANNDEVALDIEMAISMAPGLSKVVVYEGSSGNTILQTMANDRSAMQISSSWTFGTSSTTTNLINRLATQGQSYFNASGDSGAYTGSPAAPTDVPYVISVGGTTLTTSGRAYAGETVWNWFNTGEGSAASSGGISSFYPIPSWQAPVSMANNQGSTTARNIPDVALTADDIWVNYGQGQSGEFGGTSAAAPLWAGFAALINQQQIAIGGTTIGFVNPAIYAIGTGSNYTQNFHDITAGNNNNSTTSSEFFAVPGYDLCTGWGTPTGAALISALAQNSPVITNAPASEVVAPGANVTFTVGAFGSGLSYQWKFNGTNIPAATSSSLSIVNAQAANQGNYAVVVSNAGGSVTTSNAFLTVNSLPSITTQPQSQTVAQGSNVTFSVVANGSPAPTYQWQLNGTNISGATATSFGITNAQLSDQGIYAVLVSNSGGTVTSSNAVLTVDAPPSLSSQPANHTVSQGSSVIFSAGATGSAPLAYQWFLNGIGINGATNPIYFIQSAQFSQAGNYVAIVTNNFGAATSTVAVLTVDAPPSITSQPQGLTLVAGSNAAFSVAVTGSTPFTFQWFLNSNPLTDNGHVTGAQTANLNIANALAADAGNYQVMVSNAFGSMSSSVATLSISQATPVLTWTNPAPITYGVALSSNQLNATANQPGTFAYNPPVGSVSSAGSNLLSVTFTPTDNADFTAASASASLVVARANLSVTASNFTRVYGQANPVFTGAIAGLQNGDNITASFTCGATASSAAGTYPIVPVLSDPSNRLGNYLVMTNNGSLTITAADPPTILSIAPTNGTTNGGDTITISGTGFQDGATVNFGALAAVSVNVTNATNIIVITPAEAAGTVDVVVTNADGQSVVLTNGFTFQPDQTTNFQAAALASQPTNQTVTLGGSANFMVNATGTGPLVYQWIFNQSNVADATNSALSLTNVQATDAGLYEVLVSNSFGATTSSIATLSVLGVQPLIGTGPGGSQFSNGQFTLQLTNLTGQGTIIIQTSSNLVDWAPIFTNPPAFGQLEFIDTNAINSAIGFYRVMTQPSP